VRSAANNGDALSAIPCPMTATPLADKSQLILPVRGEVTADSATSVVSVLQRAEIELMRRHTD
jgi:hypothetical protein